MLVLHFYSKKKFIQEKWKKNENVNLIKKLKKIKKPREKQPFQNKMKYKFQQKNCFKKIKFKIKIKKKILKKTKN